MISHNKAVLAKLAGKLAFAQRTKGIRAMPMKLAVKLGIVGTDLVVDTLEGPMQAKSDQMLCRGALDELWPQDEAKILTKYIFNPSKFTVSVHGEKTWSHYDPMPGHPILAAAYSKSKTFTVQASYGTLEGKRGDYVCMNPQDKTDMWIVKKAAFESTYEFVE